MRVTFGLATLIVIATLAGCIGAGEPVDPQLLVVQDGAWSHTWQGNAAVAVTFTPSAGTMLQLDAKYVLPRQEPITSSEGSCMLASYGHHALVTALHDGRSLTVHARDPATPTSGASVMTDPDAIDPTTFRTDLPIIVAYAASGADFGFTLAVHSDQPFNVRIEPLAPPTCGTSLRAFEGELTMTPAYTIGRGLTRTVTMANPGFLYIQGHTDVKLGWHVEDEQSERRAPPTAAVPDHLGMAWMWETLPLSPGATTLVVTEAEGRSVTAQYIFLELLAKR